MYEASETHALTCSYEDVWLIAGVRTPFADYMSVLSDISPTDLGIHAARALLARTGIAPRDVGTIIAGNMAQSSFDAYYLPRHIGLYAGVPLGVPALLVHRLCGTGFETILTAADQIALGKAKLALCVGAESMSRNPVAAYTHRGGFRLGQIAAAVLVASGEYVRAHGLKPLARIIAGATVGVPPEIMGIGPAPAIRAVVKKAGLKPDDVARFDINEAFGAQYLAVEKELALDRAKVNVNGGAIAIGHPLAASGVRLTTTVARELRRTNSEYGISSACAGGGQGIAILLKNAA